MPGAGFGTLTEIDVRATPQEKLGQDMESYTLGPTSTECVRFASEVSRTECFCGNRRSPAPTLHQASRTRVRNQRHATTADLGCETVGR